MPQPCLQLVQRYAVGHHVLGETVAQRVVTNSFTWGFGAGLLCRGPATGSSGGGEPAKLIDAKPANMVDAGHVLLWMTRRRSATDYLFSAFVVWPSALSLPIQP